MKHLLLPDYDFETYAGATPDFLKSLGKDILLCDVDNTLVPYDEPCPTDGVRAWAKSLTDAGIKIVLVSNNDKERLEKFNESLKLPYLCKSGKPSRKTVRNALAAIDGTKDRAVMLGDQLLTDVITARISGITALWVPTIKKVETPFFRFKSAVEKPFIKHYFKKKRKNSL